MHRPEPQCLGELACGRPGSTRVARAPLTEPADAVSAFGNDPVSQGIRDRIDRPPMPRGQPLAHPTGWSPDMGASPVGDAGLYLSDVPVYWPLPSPQGLRGPSNFLTAP